MPVKALVACGANALALLPPHAQRGLVLVVGIGAGKSTEGTVSVEEPGNAISVKFLSFNCFIKIKTKLSKILKLKTFGTFQSLFGQNWRRVGAPWQSV